MNIVSTSLELAIIAAVETVTIAKTGSPKGLRTDKLSRAKKLINAIVDN
jgi:hypothetical protein